VRYPNQSPGERLGPGDADEWGCGWPVQSLGTVSSSWRSGLYVLQFTDRETPQAVSTLPLGQEAFIVVRPTNGEPGSTALFQLNVNTWAAYHMWRNRSLYAGRTNSGERFDELRASKVSFRRPGTGFGLPNETVTSPSPPKAAYAVAFIDWIEREGLSVDCCTGQDVSAGNVGLDDYRTVISVGHDEYWSRGQFDAVSAYRSRGGNTVFFGGNLAYWRVRECDEGTGIECYKRSAGSAEVHLTEAEEPLDRIYPGSGDAEELTTEMWWLSEQATIPLTGVYMHVKDPAGPQNLAGAAWWWEEVGGPGRPAKGFTVVEPEHWAFEGTGLRVGDNFGADVKLIGHEADGLLLDYDSSPPRLTMSDGALAGTQLLAYADCREWGEYDFSVWPPRRRPGEQVSNCAFGGSVTMIHRHREDAGEGMLFVAPVNDWAFGLTRSLDWTDTRNVEPEVREANPTVVQVTRNVLARCGLEPRPRCAE
jgi:hypothetical protein